MTRNRKSILAIYHTLSVLSAAMLFNLWVAAQSSDQAELKAWREHRETQLKTDDGWLTVSGLFWLKEGINSVGSAPGRDVRLPVGSAPDQAGQIVFQQGKAVFHVADGSIATMQQQTIREAVLKSDAEENSHPVVIGDLSLHLIKRGARYGIRLKDKNSLARKHFTKLDWFPNKREYRLVADFIPYSAPKEVSVVNIIGDVEKMKSPGYVVFSLNGNEYSLEPVTSGKGKLFFIFRDLTSGIETYKPGRFLYADAPVDGKVILDFNKAINPPCTFTAYATCPLPTKRNYLQARIEAGEKAYHAPWHEIAAESRIREEKR
ncbi:MAG: DUF1684 domain-containing protein [Acidobacteria bacterium]|nr:DUF1684 domain-containing protein [Acidobacteriota bacterium]